MNLKDETLKLHAKARGKLATGILTPVTNREELSLVYTPGVGAVSTEIAQDKEKVWQYTIKGHTVAIVSDGSAVLGLGNIGPEAALPVMEGKAVLFKTFADIDAFPICLDTQDSQEIIKTVKYLAPVFGGINLEDISAPRCFEIEAALQDLGIPVMHDDQHGTSIVVLAGLLNAAKVVGKELTKLKVVICGAGAAGSAIARILVPKVGNLVITDSKGIISKSRTDLDSNKIKLLEISNKDNLTGTLEKALVGADVFIGVSKAGALLPEYIKEMGPRPIVFALANPIPEIMPDAAKAAGAEVVATGRSDFGNQINNSLAFPGVFKGAMSVRAKRITLEMKLAAAEAIAQLVENPTAEMIIPDPFTPGLVAKVAAAVAGADVA